MTSTLNSLAQLHAALLSGGRLSAVVSPRTWDLWRSRALENRDDCMTIDYLAIQLGLSWPDSRARDTLADFAHLTLSALQARPTLGRKKLSVLITCFALAADVFQDDDTVPSTSAHESSTPLSADGAADQPSAVASQIKAVLLQLKAREADVVRRRFGLEGRERQTLEQIGQHQDYGITRERVRQIESSALRRLSHAANRDVLRGALSRDADRIWRALSGGILLDRRKAQSAAGSLDPETLLAIDIVQGSAERWLQENATILGSLWHRVARSASSLATLGRRIDDWVQEREALQAVPIETLSAVFREDYIAVQVTAASRRSLSVFFGYIVRGNLFPRMRRRVRLHRLMRREWGHQCVPALELTSRYRSVFSNDQCSIRDLELVMQDAPHLFLRCAEAGWVPLGGSSDFADWQIEGQLDHSRRSTHGTLGPSSDDRTPTRLSHVIRTALLRDGPLHLAHIVATCRREAVGDYAPSSVGPMLATGNYVRLAPGVWGLPEHHETLDSESCWYSILLSELDCRHYVRARHAGEPASLYRMWTPAMEFRWTLWAERHASNELYSSLLTICDPNRWPASAGERSNWIKRKREFALYRLRESLKYPVSQNLPTLGNLLRVALVAQTRGQVSWISANQVVGRRIDSHRSAANLAALVELGVVLVAKHWQDPHLATTGCTSFVTTLLDYQHDMGTLNWQSSVGGGLLREVSRDKNRRATGWVTEEVRSALRMACAGKLDLDAEREAHSDLARPKASGAHQPSDESIIETFLEEL